MYDVGLPQRLRSAESDFLAALESGTTALASYCQTWSTLPDILRTASRTGSVAHETLSLAHSVASRIENLASYFLDIGHGEESYTTSLQRDCDAMFLQMAALDLNANPKSLQPGNRNNARCSRSPPSTLIAGTEASFPRLFPSAHQWLMDNLHNPYPTANVKARIAASSSCEVSSVNSWFINARRRIGWTTLCREHFSNCRADMIDAAYRAFVEEDPQRMLSPEIRHSFIALKVAAETLYSSTFTRSVFCGDLEQDSKPAEIEKRSQNKEPNFREAQEIERHGESSATERKNPQAVQDSYSSPFPTNENEEDVGPPVVAGSKRRWSSIEPVNNLSSTSQPIKRLRTSITSRTCLPSPSSSTDGIDGPSDDSPPEPHSVHATLLETNNLSPSHDSLAAPPCLHTVSDTLPHPNPENENGIDEWFSTNFDDLFVIPPPVDATEPDFSASWEVELFKDYSIPGNSEYAQECPPAHTHTPTSSSDLSELDSLLQSLGNDARVSLSDSVVAPSITGPPYKVSLDSSVPDISQTNIDWSSLFDGTEAYQPILYPALSQYPVDFQPLPEIDLSMLQLPQAMPAVDSQGDFASKEAKLHQLHAMQEAVRRMEQELRSEGVVIE